MVLPDSAIIKLQFFYFLHQIDDYLFIGGFVQLCQVIPHFLANLWPSLIIVTLVPCFWLQLCILLHAFAPTLLFSNISHPMHLFFGLICCKIQQLTIILLNIHLDPAFPEYVFLFSSQLWKFSQCSIQTVDTRIQAVHSVYAPSDNPEDTGSSVSDMSVYVNSVYVKLIS